jgi:hypothetical protein
LASSNSIQKKCKALLPGVEFSFWFKIKITPSDFVLVLNFYLSPE